MRISESVYRVAGALVNREACPGVIERSQRLFEMVRAPCTDQVPPGVRIAQHLPKYTARLASIPPPPVRMDGKISRDRRCRPVIYHFQRRKT